MEEAIAHSGLPLPPSLPQPRDGSASPAAKSSTRLETRDGAYELKFLLRDTQVERVIDWAGEHLAADPHASRTADGTYQVCSVYLDTDDLAVYRRRPGFRSSKFRLRRYGEEASIYLEEKRKRQGWVSKVRSRISEPELIWLQAPELPTDWAGAWFRQALEERQLTPCCQVTYRRLAREGMAEGEPVRLTLDREIRCAEAASLYPGAELNTQIQIPITLLELKFRNGLPLLFKGLIRTFGLSAAPASKYRRAAEACGLALPE